LRKTNKGDYHGITALELEPGNEEAKAWYKKVKSPF
jgi:hypothetical protein